MVGPVMDHVAALAERCEVAPARAAEGRVVVEMGGRKIDGLARHADRLEWAVARLAAKLAAAAVAPGVDLGIPPDAIGSSKLRDIASMRALAVLAPTAQAKVGQ